MQFMQRIYALNETDNRKLRFLYGQSGIDTRYSVVGDYTRPLPEWKFYPQTESLEPFPTLEQRMSWFNRFAAPLSLEAIRNCLEGKLMPQQITHLITVSCTGMSAPGLDLQLVELMDLPRHTYRSSVNFMGCYAAIHALKQADAICRSETNARVLVVCTELCTLHFQREPTANNIASSLLFGDGSAAVLVSNATSTEPGLQLHSFYAEIIPRGKQDMAWELSSSGFQMTLSSYVPELIETDISALVQRALEKAGCTRHSIANWCIHPGGKRILQLIAQELKLAETTLDHSYAVLKEYGNMSSATLLFVLQRIMRQPARPGNLLAAAFGPGLTMETFVASC